MYVLKVKIVAYSTVCKCILVDELDVLKSLDGLKLRTVEECAVLDSLKSGGEYYLLKSCEVSECISTDVLNALGNNDFLYVVVTDVGDLCSVRLFLVYYVACLKILSNIHIVRECILTNLGEEHILGNFHSAGVHLTGAEVTVERGACSLIRIFNLDADGLGGVCSLAIHEKCDCD